MKRAAWISIAVILISPSTAIAAPEQCRFIEPRAKREACYQRQESVRAARKDREAQQAAQQRPYEPMAQDDAELAKSLRSICRGC